MVADVTRSWYVDCGGGMTGHTQFSSRPTHNVITLVSCKCQGRRGVHECTRLQSGGNCVVKHTRLWPHRHGQGLRPTSAHIDTTLNTPPGAASWLPNPRCVSRGADQGDCNKLQDGVLNARGIRSCMTGAIRRLPTP
jgi:hypothetical protein